MASTAEQDNAAAAEEAKMDRLSSLLVGNIFQAVVQHVVVLQSEVALFTAACGGDTGKAMKALSTSTGLVGVLGLVINQIGGKLSDAYGRRRGYACGPIMNMIVAAIVCKNSKNLTVLIAARIMKLIFTTFSGTVITSASIADGLALKQQMQIGSKINGWVGVAVMGAPFLEAAVLKRTGDPCSSYKVLALLSAFQLLYSTKLPETLKVKKPFDMANLNATLTALNPLGFLKIYFGDSNALKRLVTILTFQSCCEGKCTSELFQMWAKNNLQWGSDGVRNLVSTWGGVVTASSLYIQPYLSKKFDIISYTSLCNFGMFAGLTITGAAPHWSCAYGGLLPIIGGINGGNSLMLKPLSTELAKAAGYGNAEFAAWFTNLRTLVQSFATIFFGQWYAYCQENNIYAGSAWWLIAVTGGLIPQLMLMASPKSDFEKPEKKA